MNCRLKFPCLIRSLPHAKFGNMLRGYLSSGTFIHSERMLVAKWGNWHCGENKEKFKGLWSAENDSILEPFIEGEAVRVLILGDQYKQIKLEGDSWLKSLHSPKARFMPVDQELLEDTRNLKEALGLEAIAVDYMISETGEKHLLEVNHIPNVTRFPEVWDMYFQSTLKWLK